MNVFLNSNSNVTAHSTIQGTDDGQTTAWADSWFSQDVVPRISVSPPKGTEKYRDASCVGELLTPEEHERAQAFVQEEWKRIYNHFSKINLENQYETLSLVEIFKIYAYLVSNSNYKKAYEEFKLISRAFDRIMDKKTFEAGYTHLKTLKGNIEKAKRYLDLEMPQEKQTQELSKKCEDALHSFHKIAKQFDPDLDNHQEIENCTQMFTECSAAISSLCLRKVEEENMSISAAVSFLASIRATIPIELSVRMLQRRTLWIDAMPYYFLRDPEFIKGADNNTQIMFYSAHQLIRDYAILCQPLHKSDRFGKLALKYRTLCLSLSHPNHDDAPYTDPNSVQANANWFRDHKALLDDAKQPLLEEMREIEELLKLS